MSTPVEVLQQAADYQRRCAEAAHDNAKINADVAKETTARARRHEAEARVFEAAIRKLSR